MRTESLADPEERSMHRVVFDRRLWLLPLTLWTVLVGGSWAWTQQSLDRYAMEMASNRGRFVFEMVKLLRLWNARHGGVYVPITEDTQPNPYLQVPERDITTPSGERLTLLNPAYMTRQVAEVAMEQGGLSVRLTSLNPLNPDNAPDPWEQAGLHAFEAGKAEHREFITNGNGPTFRYLAPLMTDPSCLECHAHQGYHAGDVRGGISVAFDARPLLATTEAQRVEATRMHLLVWALVAALTLFTLSRHRRQLVSLSAAKAQQDTLVAIRTRELREEVAERELAEARLRLLLESSGEGVYGVDDRGRCTFCNHTALELLGLERPEQVLGQDMHRIVHQHEAAWGDGQAGDCPLVASYRQGRPVHDEDETFFRADGEAFAVEYRSQPLYDGNRLLGAVVTFADISNRRAREAELRKLSAAVHHSPESIVITDTRGTIEYVNEQFTRITGYTAEEVTGHNARMLQSGETPPETYAALWTTIRAGKVWEGELVNRKKGGETYWEAMSVAPITNDRGTITHFVALKQDVTERKRLQEQIWRQANYDPLTGLVNRSLFRDRLEQLLVQRERDGGVFALLFLDLDRFKEINDRFGHEAGDQVLRQVAARLHGCLRQVDTAARLGGDEFTVLLPQVGTSRQAERVARKILDSLAAPLTFTGGRETIEASIGIALYPVHGEDAKTLLQHADAAMYEAKLAGRSHFCVYGREAAAPVSD